MSSSGHPTNSTPQLSSQNRSFRIRNTNPTQGTRFLNMPRDNLQERRELNFYKTQGFSRPTEVESLPRICKTHSQFKSKEVGRKTNLTTSEEFKMIGLWDQYEDIWFDIQSSSVLPLFSELSLPKFKNSVKYKRMLHQIPMEDKPREISVAFTPILQKQKPYQIRLLKSKLKTIEEDLLPCDNCNKKKRKGMQLGCKHYFCRDCIRGHVQTHIQELKVPVKCLSENCKYKLERTEIISNAADSASVMRLFDAIVADNAKRRPDQFVLCFTDNCKYLFDLKRQKDKQSIRCPRCHKNYCIACHNILKPGHHCEDSNEAKEMENHERRTLVFASPK